jgi:uncharacterized protein (TIGR02452 family)
VRAKVSLRAIAEQTLSILDRGYYEAASGRVHIAREQRKAEEGTELIRPGDLAKMLTGPGRVSKERSTVCSVTREKTQEAAQRLVQTEGVDDLVILNFASARNPGGGFLNGAAAQEEDIARSSGLYKCLKTQPDYYEANRACASTLYTDHIVYSPGVPWFRGSKGQLLEEAYLASIITAPAPNAREYARGATGDDGQIRDTLNRRAGNILAVAERKGHGTVLLGAWGCGVFGNDPRVVAAAFMSHLKGRRFRRSFKRIVFAIFDTSKAHAKRRAFERRVLSLAQK